MADPNELSETEKELHEAMKTEAPEAEDAEIAPEPGDEAEPEAAAPERDDKGRFAKKDAAEPEKAEGEPEDKPAAEDEASKKGMVPIQALDSERSKRREADTENAGLRQELDQLRAMLQQMQQPQQQTAQQAPEKMPDPVLDPEGHEAWLARKFEAMQQPYRQQQEQSRLQQQQQAQKTALLNFAKTHEDDFRGKYPDKDYDGALNFARQRVASNLRLMGYSAPEVEALVHQQEIATAAMCRERGLHPAAYVYNFALDNGFTEAAKAAPVEADEGENISRLEDARQRTATTANASGSARVAEKSADELARMSEDQLAKYAKDNPEAFKRAMGA